jgi:GDP-L-fucose synthase
MRTYSDMGHINVGVGEDVSIHDLARLIADVIGYKGEFHYDSSKPDGTPRKLLDISTLTGLGWQARIGLRDGIDATYRWYLDNVADA